MVDYHTENASKRRKYDYTEEEDDSMEEIIPGKLNNNNSNNNTNNDNSNNTGGWSTLQPILENDILCAKIPTSNLALDLLAKWFQIIVADEDKLRVFRQWIMSSPAEGDKKPSPSPNQLVPTVKLAEIKRDTDDVPSTDPTVINAETSKAASIDYINNDIPITPRSTPQVLLLQQLLQKQQQQIVILQKLQTNGPTEGMAVVPTANTIGLAPSIGSAGVVLTVSTKTAPWHPFSESCTCTCGFTAPDGTVTKSQRVPGGGEGEMRFVVPPIPFPQESTQIRMAVALTSCAAPHAPLVCADSFTYGRERASSAVNSDEDSEDTPDSSVCDDDEDDDADSSRELSPSPSSASPKQLMTVRERMLDFINSTPSKSNARVMVAQAPPNRVVWKNRRLDTPFKIRVEGVSCDTPATKLAVLALVVDHKGKLQIDAMENFDEECNPQGIALFHNLRMTKGTWGKEWSITFVVVLKASLSSNPVVVGVSQPCPVVVKTRKNPQVRHINRSESPSPVSFVESRKPDTSIRKRNRVEDILDNPTVTSTSSSSSSSSSRSHSEAMTNLLYAAEIKQQEREYRPSSAPSSAPNSPARSNMMLPSLQGGFSNTDSNFANLQGLLGYLEDIKIKHHPSLSIIEQPQLKRDGKVLIVKKGKPFRTPFRLQMRTSPQAHSSNYGQVPDYNPQQYVCVAVLRNDKGEEVALKNSEVLFDARGLATFSGLMVMKGTWGKSVSLTFEARWSGARRIIGGSNWPPLRMLVVSETPALQLMCYTKDKKTPAAV